MAEISAIILAAGQGKRMRSSLPKVAHPVAGKPMLWYVARAAKSAGIAEIVFVLGPGREKVQGTVEEFGGKVAVQESQLGTGDAARCGLAALSPRAKEIVVLCGDAPLVLPRTLRTLLLTRRKRRAAAAVLTGILPNPSGYGRVLRSPDGSVARIVEERDGGPEIRKIREVNSGTYVFDRKFLERNLPRLTDVNVQREFYLTDLVVQALQEGKIVVPVVAKNPDEVRGINSRKELAEANEILRKGKIDALMDAGVTVVAPDRVYIEPEVSVGPDSVIEPGAVLLGKTRIGRGVRIQAGCVIEDSRVDDGAHLLPYSVILKSRVRKGASVGPFARLRPEADIGEDARIGNFVEVKKSRIGKGSKANHLAYLGDSLVGKKANIGAGTITCNYDGLAKHTTVIGDGVFVGSDTQFVAPVTIGKGALIGAGATITKDVPPYALALSRAEQKVIETWVIRRMPDLLRKAGLSVPPVKEKK
ncbi:MAG TPA: bifunctional UDP-N-acetylglucosamine diphosphorylase/glucosamine-1-phosphate N-acetyltransferase GlmU [Candidatus Deferrimicrobiaceae bacterium]|nr:bifunctional UDP-N-acetylglucosamine diphosphorylase/glucosamine-1-phosphate N-acetyltransferase GlmU [Candidatus Deferrimicrobiaceae bacterium]